MLFRIATLVASLTIVSKILGLARDLVIAHYFGTSMLADAFNMAYIFTGNIFVIFGGIGGPFYSSVVAILPKLQGKPLTAWLFSKKLLIKASIISVVFGIICFFVRVPVLKIFVDPNRIEYFKLTLTNIEILLPLIVICAPIGILYGILNCYKKYYAPSLSPAILNIALIVAVFFMGDASSGLALALGTSIGGVLSLVVNFGSFAEVKKEIFGSPEMKGIEHEPEDLYIKEYYKLLYPTLMSTLISQLVVLADSFFCRGLPEGSWTAITLANRIVQMPLGVLVTGFLVPLFPRISELVFKDNIPEIKRLVKKSLISLTLLCLPAIVIGMIWSDELIKIVFQRGAFDERSTAMVSGAFFYLCLSIIPYFVRDTYTRVCYSFGNSKAPFYGMLVAIVLKFALNSFLVPLYGLNGMAMATAIVSVVNAGVLFWVVKRSYLK